MSTINTGSIDVSYPIPGKNNSTQGFRDNFTAIKNNLDISKNEISDLQNKVLVKSALSGSSLDNDMANTLISNALTLGFRNTTFNLGGNLSGNVMIDLIKGDVQYGTVTGNIALQFSKWSPDETQSSVELILDLSSQSTVYNISLPSSVNSGTKTLEYYSGSGVGGMIKVPSSANKLHFKFTSIDCGESIEIQTLNTPRISSSVSFTTQAPSPTGSPGDFPGMIRFDSSNLYCCVAAYNGSSVIWKKVSLSAI
jgi:hypothetical protein